MLILTNVNKTFTNRQLDMKVETLQNFLNEKF